VKRLSWALIIPLLSSCSNLAAVNDISSRLVTASSSWDDVASDIAGSCQRERTLNPELRDCQSEQSASDGMMGANALLRNYFQALGDAANESNFVIQPGLDTATASVANIPGINTDQVQAASGLFAALAKVATEAMRESTLRELVQHAPEARSLIRGLDAPLVSRLGRRFDSERIQLQAEFGRLILAQGDRVTDIQGLCDGSGAASFSGTGFLLAQEYCRRSALIEERQKALSDYQASLQDADNALADLQTSQTQLKGRALAKRLYNVASDLEAKVSAVRKAFA
jgi:hypothetical protein